MIKELRNQHVGGTPLKPGIYKYVAKGDCRGKRGEKETSLGLGNAPRKKADNCPQSVHIWELPVYGKLGTYYFPNSIEPTH